MNKILLIGRIATDLEIKYLNDRKYLKSKIAVQRDFKNKEGKYDTDFFNFTVWGNQAEYLQKYSKKGDQIALAGKLLNNNYERNGETIYSNIIQVENVEIIWGTSNKKEKTNDELNKEVMNKLGVDVVEFLD